MLAIIGGSGLSKLDILEGQSAVQVATPYQANDVEVLTGHINGSAVAFLPRHGSSHVIPPHRVNYRANLWALHKLGVTDVVAVNAVGGINPIMSPGQFAIPDQIIDYTFDRSHTFYEENLTEVVHIDFTHPYSKKLRQLLIIAIEQDEEEALETDAVLSVTRGVYGCTQGPRLETAAEIRRMRNDGCDMVGMTGMPEAALARELGLHYACLALSVNWAAGLKDEPITMEAINSTLSEGMVAARKILCTFVALFAEEHSS